MTNVAALKRLAAAIVGGGITADDVPGDTNAEVIDYIAKYEAGEYVAALTVTSVAGTTTGTTKVTVTPALTSGNSYVYQTNPSQITSPDYLETVDYAEWNGTADITAEDDHYIGIYEVNSDSQVVGFGQSVITAKLT